MSSLPDSTTFADRLDPIISPDEVLGILGRYLDGSVDPDTPDRPPHDQPERTRSEEDTDLSLDRPETLNDLLDRAPLALSLASLVNRIWHEQNPNAGAAPRTAGPVADDPAFVMHLDAPWGGGKTTIANFIEALLSWDGSEPYQKAVDQILNARRIAEGKPDPPRTIGARLRRAVGRDRPPELPRNPFARLDLGDPATVWPDTYLKNPWTVVWFNAWRNQHVRPPWWNFYEVIRSAFLDDRSPADRAAAWLSEAWWKLDKRRLALNVGLVVLLLAFFSLDSTAMTGWWSGQGTPPGPVSGIAAWLGSISGPLIALGGGAAALFFSIRTGAQNLLASVSESANSTALGDSDPLDKFRKRFVDMVETRKSPVLVIIDDLDRCEPDYVVELLRGIITVFRTPRVVFLLLGDRFWIEQCFEQAHPEMAAAHGKGGIGFGGHFVEKAIQLSFLLPEPPEARRKEYLRHLLRTVTADGATASTDRPSLHGAAGAEPEAQVARETAKAAKEDSDERQAQDRHRSDALAAASETQPGEKISHMLLDLGAELPPNPRRIKRIVNMTAIYRISLLLQYGRGDFDRYWPALVLWVFLMSEHPAAWRALCADPSLADKALREKPPDGTDDPCAALRGEDVRKFLTGEILTGVQGAKLDTSTVEALRRLTPIA